MWVITANSDKNNVVMVEFDEEKEAREAFEKNRGYKILSELVYLDDYNPILVTT